MGRFLLVGGAVIFTSCQTGKVGDTDVNGHQPDAKDTGQKDGDDTGQHVNGPATDLSLEVSEEMGSIVMATWTQDAEAISWLEYSFDEGVWLASPPELRSPGEVEALALGVPFETEVAARVAWDDGTETGVSDAVTITTDPLPSGAPHALSVEGDNSAWDLDMGWVFMSIYGPGKGISGSWNVIIDRQGRVVWALRTNPGRISLHPRVSHDGTSLLIDQNTFWSVYDGGAAAEVTRVKIDGTVTDTYETPGMHHPFTELADGSIVWTATNNDWMDTLVVLTSDGDVEEIFSCSDFHDELEVNTYCASNTVFWDEESDVFLISFYSTETVVEIDHQTGEVLRWFGHLDGSWGFDPEDSIFYWQHGVHYTDEGTLLVSTKGREAANETVVREYSLESETETLTEVWSFGEGQGVYGEEMGEVHRLDGGNVLHNYGTETRLREATPDGVVVWDIEWGAVAIGRSTPLSDLYALAP